MRIYTYEKIGLIPQSISRTLGRFLQQFFLETKTSALKELLISRQQMRIAVQCFLILLIVPVLVNWLSKSIFIKPLTEYFWNKQQNEIFLNSYQTNRAYLELKKTEEILFFESLTENVLDSNSCRNYNEHFFFITKDEKLHSYLNKNSEAFLNSPKPNEGISTNEKPILKICLEKSFKQQFQQKLFQIAMKYNKESIQAITDLIGDLLTLITIRLLFIWLEPQIFILKGFLMECFFSLSDANKSLLMLLFADLLVGYHSPRGWKLATELMLQHYGLPENSIFIGFFIGTMPVLIDSVFKYWVFRHLNSMSPSTVVTYHALIE